MYESNQKVPRLPFFIGHEGVHSKRRAAPEGYRAATLVDIMHICCDVGCDIRDLLAYCDPFGPWNS